MVPWVDHATLFSTGDGTEKWISHLDTLAKLYSLADKYLMTNLKEEIGGKFDQRLQGLKVVDEFLDILPFVYESTPASDRGLRDLCVKHGKAFWESMILSPKWKDTLGANAEFMQDVVSGLLVSSRGQCGGCGSKDCWQVCACGKYTKA